MCNDPCEEYRQETILTKLMYDQVENLLDELIEKLDKPFPFCEKIKGYDCAEHCPMGDMGCYRDDGKPKLISRLQAHLRYIRNGTIDQNKEVIRWIETFQKEIPQLSDFDNDGGEVNWITLTPKK